MAKFMTTKEASEKWVIPADAVKPADKRLKGGGVLCLPVHAVLVRL